MTDRRRDFLRRFAAGAIAAACGGRATFAADTPPPPPPQPYPAPVYGPPPIFQPPLPPGCGVDPRVPCVPEGGKTPPKNGG